jgi:REP element-mobilizing transposase RayT
MTSTEHQVRQPHVVERHWFFTWRTYGTWLPGEDGFVGPYRSPDGRRVSDNAPGSPTAEPIPLLARYAVEQLTHPPVLLTNDQCETVERELLRSCGYRGWVPDALAVMPNHLHILFGVNGDPDHDGMLAELKAYCSRQLNKPVHRPRGWWWADGGSTRLVTGEGGRGAVIDYIRKQPGAVRVWMSEEAKTVSCSGSECG